MATAAADLPPHLRDGPPAGERAAIALADGEHYPAVVVDSLRALAGAGWKLAAVVLLGGSEKLRGDLDYMGLPLVRAREGEDPAAVVGRALDETDGVRSAIDLSDEPVLTFERRMRVIAELASRGVTYRGPDTVVVAPQLEEVQSPSLAIIGTGKRIGKTAISAHVATLADAALDGERPVVVIAMGRGGPAEPVVIDSSQGAVDVGRLLEISRAGAHAASDYLEDAALTGLTTIGCRRSGGGLLGVPVQSNVPLGARLAAALEPRLVVVEGSGSCVPPVRCDRTILIASAARPRDLLDDVGHYRLLLADLVLVVGDDAAAGGQLAQHVRDDYGLPAVAVRLEPGPVGPVDGRRVAAFTTAPEHVGDRLAANLRSAGAQVALVSHQLARRDRLREDVASAIEARVDALAVEIKAAAIDVVAELADEHGIDVLFLHNPPAPHDGEPSLEQELLVQIRAAAREPG